VTLVLTVNGPESIWLLADRRLSSGGRPMRDDARKVMLLETIDGTAILGYAGVGATALGTEPGDWMSGVLRGRNLPLEQSLLVLTEAIKKQLPRHMRSMPKDEGRAHHVFVTAFVGKEPRFYTIDLIISGDRESHAFRCARQIAGKPELGTPPRVGIAGTGQLYLLARKKQWMRSLLCVVRAHDRGHISPFAVADHLASLNHQVHLGISDKSVGPRCVVAWRYPKEGVHKWSGSSLFYTGKTRDPSLSGLPIIGCGLDVRALSDLMMPRAIKRSKAMQAGQPFNEPTLDELNAELACLPDKPDENLR
jgi:hypothetical protein